MAASMTARISFLYKTEEEWKKQVDFAPDAGELVCYAPDRAYDYVRVKIGDGSTKLRDLPFCIDSAAVAVFNKLTYSNIVDAGRI
jgi:hypothetical protein